MQFYDVNILGGPIAEKFGQMQIPGGIEGIVVIKTRDMQEKIVRIGYLGDRYVVESRSGDSKDIVVSSIDSDLYRQLLHEARNLGIFQLGAVFADDILDGETFFVSIIDNNESHRAVFGNPRECESQLIQIADFLDQIVDLPDST
jgi:hypothetical protein